MNRYPTLYDEKSRSAINRIKWGFETDFASEMTGKRGFSCQKVGLRQGKKT